jgi:hypothetical protein
MPNWKAMHFSRVGTFLLGAWMGCSLFLAVLAFENVRFAGRLAAGSISSMEPEACARSAI